MGCMVEFTESLFQVEFCTKGAKQKILIEVLIRYSDMDINELAFMLGVSAKQLSDICEGRNFLVGIPADSLAQIFLRFFGQQFFGKFNLIRNFVN